MFIRLKIKKIYISKEVLLFTRVLLSRRVEKNRSSLFLLRVIIILLLSSLTYRAPHQISLIRSRHLKKHVLHTRGSHQNHVTCGDVHVGVGGLLAPGGDAAPGRGADGRTGIAELGGDAVDPGGEGLRALAGGLDGHALPAQLLQERQAALACC